ncbi:unnamed protein product, partial [marine sediment metagenome]
DPLRNVERGCKCSCCGLDRGNSMVYTFEHKQADDCPEVVICQTCLNMAVEACFRAKNIPNFVPRRDGPMLESINEGDMQVEMASIVWLAEDPDRLGDPKL